MPGGTTSGSRWRTPGHGVEPIGPLLLDQVVARLQGVAVIRRVCAAAQPGDDGVGLVQEPRRAAKDVRLVLPEPGDLGQREGRLESIAELVAEVAGQGVELLGFCLAARVVVHHGRPQGLARRVGGHQRARGAVHGHAAQIAHRPPGTAERLGQLQARPAHGVPPRRRRLLVAGRLAAKDLRAERDRRLRGDRAVTLDRQRPHPAGADVDSQKQCGVRWHGQAA